MFLSAPDVSSSIPCLSSDSLLFTLIAICCLWKTAFFIRVVVTVLSRFSRPFLLLPSCPNNHPMALNIESILGEKAQYLTKEESTLANDMSTLVVIDGIAVVDEEKAKKLTLFLLKKILPFGSVVKNDIFIPMDPETKMSLG